MIGSYRLQSFVSSLENKLEADGIGSSELPIRGMLVCSSPLIRGHNIDQVCLLQGLEAS